jgi:hypothetical protein
LAGVISDSADNQSLSSSWSSSEWAQVCSRGSLILSHRMPFSIKPFLSSSFYLPGITKP